MAIPQTGNKAQKSVKLTEEEHKTLVELRDLSHTDTAFSKTFNIDRVSLIRITTLGSGSSTNVTKIRRKLSRINSLSTSK